MAIIMAPPCAGLRFCGQKSSACQVKKTDFRDAQIKGADCQASATPKNASKGDFQPKHFLGLRLIDKTIFCKVSLSNE